MNRHLARWAPFALVFLFLSVVGARQQASPSIGLINLNAVMEQMPGFELARQTWESELAQYEQEMIRMQDTLNAKIAAFDQQQVVLSPTARQEKQAELQGLQQQIQSRAQELQTRSGERQRELLAPLEMRVQAVVDGIRAERNLAVIFDVASQASPIISADTGLDLTDTVVQRLQAQQQQ